MPFTVDFFLAGAPKCGTTALAEYLARHPQIFVTEPKEPQFFTTDFPGHRGVSNWEDYKRLFQAAAEKSPHVLKGEGSVWYLYSLEAIPRIRDAFPSAKLIILLRRPDEMLPSLYGQQRQGGIESAPSFQAAWMLEAERRKGARIPLGCRTPEFLFYREVARYARQLDRLYHCFPKEQVKVLLYDDFRRNPEVVYQEVLEFLGVEICGLETYPIVNPYADVRSATLQSTLTWVLGHARQFRAFARRRFRVDPAKLRVHRPMIEAIQGLNLKPMDKPELPDMLRREIIDHYRAEIEELAIMLGRDLSSWCEIP